MNRNDLPVPEAVEAAARSMEMARVWVCDGKQIVALSPNLWNDPGTWGLMLVDLARHLARQYAAAGWTEVEVLNRIRATFDAEWSSPTSAVEDA